MPVAPPARVPLSDVVCALGAALLVLLAGAWLLARLPALPGHTATTPQVQLRWMMPSAPGAVLPVPPSAPPLVGMPQAVAAATPTTGYSVPGPVATPPSSAAPVISTPASPAPPAAPATLFDRGGRAQLPSQAVADGVERRSSAQRVFEQHDQTAFEHPDRGLFERAETAGTAQSGAQRALFGRDVQAAQARQAPALAYNPRLHERPSDLAAADGPQAYLAAPIADAPAPGLDGQASAQLRPQQAQRRDRAQACRLPAVASAWTALEQHLGLLQQAEYRMGHGSSPEERRHTLTHEIGRQYNLARRALWQVDRLLPGCAQGSAG